MGESVCISAPRVSLLIKTQLYLIRDPPLQPHLTLITSLKTQFPNRIILALEQIHSIYEFWEENNLAHSNQIVYYNNIWHIVIADAERVI